MEKKNKKKLFAIIGGSVLAFVLTIALSVSITLAYFGGSGTATQKITLGANVAVADSTGAAGKVTLGQNIPNALPGQVIDVTVDANITSSGEQRAAVMLLIEGDTSETLELASDSGWVHYGSAVGTDDTEYTVYLLGTAAAMTTVDATEAGKAMTQFSGKYTVDPEIDNASNKAGTDLESFSATVVAVQYGTNPSETAVPDNSLGFVTATEGDIELKTIFEDVAEVTITAAA